MLKPLNVLVSNVVYIVSSELGKINKSNAKSRLSTQFNISKTLNLVFVINCEISLQLFIFNDNLMT